MPTYKPEYQVTIYAPRSEDATETTPLTPRAGSIHSDPFQVSTLPGVTGFLPYLAPPRGRRGKIDLRKRKTDVGSMSFRVLDKRTGSGNAERWVTAFAGDEQGRSRMRGCLVRIRERTTEGGAFSDFFVGRVHSVSLDDRVVLNVTARSIFEDMKLEIFRTGINVPYGFSAPLLPTSFVEGRGYGVFPTVSGIPGFVEGGGALFTLHESRLKTDGEGAYLATVTATLRDIMRGYTLDLSNIFATTTIDPVEIRAKILTGTNAGQTFAYRPAFSYGVNLAGFGSVAGRLFGPMRVRFDANGQAYFYAIALRPVDPGHPDYGPLPDPGAEVDFAIYHNAAPSEKRPVLLLDVHPVTLLKDLLDGKFGPLNPDMTGQVTIRRDSATFDALEADDSFELLRFVITEPEPMLDFIEDAILLPCGLALRENLNGEVEVVDVREPDSVAGVPTITDADLAGDPPSWESNDDAVTRVRVISYIDVQDDVDVLADIEGTFPDIPAGRIRSEKVETNVIRPGRLFGDTGDKPLKVDARGFRYTLDPEAEEDGGLDRADSVRRAILAMTAGLFGPFGDGTMETTLPGLRSSANVESCLPGDLRILDVDALPDPASNLRGGARVARCVERVEKDARIDLTFVDLGANLVAVTPSVGALAPTTGDERHSIDVPVTLNAAGEPVRLEIASTFQSVGVRPAEGSRAWRFAGFAEATGTIAVEPVPSRRRVWVRARTESRTAEGKKLPSSWVYSSGNDYADTASYTAPSAVTQVEVTGSYLTASWTPGEASLATRVVLVQGADERLVEVLPPGSDRISVLGLDPSTSYTLKVAHVDEHGGDTTEATLAFSTTATLADGPPVLGWEILIGEIG